MASPAYLAERRPIREPRDLENHECLAFALQPKDAWYFRPGDAPSEEPIEIAVRGRLRANDSEALLDAVLAALGVALSPTWLTGDHMTTGRLTAILPAWEALIAPGPDRAIWGVYPHKKVVSPKVRAFLAFLDQRFGKPPYWDRSAGAASRAAPPES